MTCGEAIAAYIKTLNVVSGRVFSPYLPQAPEPAQLPCILVQQIDDVQEPHLRGTAGIKEARIQIDCVGRTFTEAKTVDQAVMGDYTGGAPTGIRGLGGVSVSNVTFHRIKTANYFEHKERDELYYQNWVTREYMVAYEG